MPQQTQCRSCKRRRLPFSQHLMQLLWYAIGFAAAGEPCLESLESICDGVRYCDVRRCTGDAATASVCSSWHSESGSDPDPRTLRVNNGRSGRSDISRDIDQMYPSARSGRSAAATKQRSVADCGMAGCRVVKNTEIRFVWKINWWRQ